MEHHLETVFLRGACISDSTFVSICETGDAMCSLHVNWPLQEAFVYASQVGYQGVEIAPFTLADSVEEVSSSRRAEIRNAAASALLRMSNISLMSQVLMLAI